MDRIHTHQDRPLERIAHAAVAITNISDTQRHIGILYRESESATLQLLHLAWHNRLRANPPNSDYVWLWIDPPIPKPRLRQLATRCRQVFRANPQGIPYAFSAPNDALDAETLEFLIGPTRHGLTCATFVLAVFEVSGLKLIQEETWPFRDDDREWQERILSALRSQSDASPEHIQAVEAEVGGIRIRPEEVAGAATQNSTPVDFPTADAMAQLVLDTLNASQN